MTFNDDTEIDGPTEGDEPGGGETAWDWHRYLPDFERDTKRMAAAVQAMNESHGFTLSLTVMFDANLQGYQAMQDFGKEGQTEEEQVADFERVVPKTTLTAQFAVSEDSAFPDIPLREMLARCVAFSVRHLTYDSRAATWCTYWGQCAIHEPNLNEDGTSNLNRKFYPFGISGLTHGFGEFTVSVTLRL